MPNVRVLKTHELARRLKLSNPRDALFCAPFCTFPERSRSRLCWRQRNVCTRTRVCVCARTHTHAPRAARTGRLAHLLTRTRSLVTHTRAHVCLRAQAHTHARALTAKPALDGTHFAKPSQVGAICETGERECGRNPTHATLIFSITVFVTHTLSTL